MLKITRRVFPAVQNSENVNCHPLFLWSVAFQCAIGTTSRAMWFALLAVILHSVSPMPFGRWHLNRNAAQQSRGDAALSCITIHHTCLSGKLLFAPSCSAPRLETSLVPCDTDRRRRRWTDKLPLWSISGCSSFGPSVEQGKMWYAALREPQPFGKVPLRHGRWNYSLSRVGKKHHSYYCPVS